MWDCIQDELPLHCPTQVQGDGAKCRLAYSVATLRSWDLSNCYGRPDDLRAVIAEIVMALVPLFDLKGKRVYVAGHNGMAGSALVRRLRAEDCEIITAERKVLDLTRQADTERWLEQNKPDAVFLAAGHVGGIYANDTFPADFIAENLAIGLNVIRGSFKAGVKKLLALGSSCIYPKFAPQPMPEESLLTGPLEPTNEWYAIAKIAAIKLCEAYRKQYGADFVSVMPTNLYGPGDNYHPQNSHVPAALIRRFHEGKVSNAPFVTVWGTGNPRREFLCSDDLADACVLVMKHYSDFGFLNVGTGKDITIAEFAEMISDIVGYQGKIIFDKSRPDGPPQKLLDVSKIKALDWMPKVPLRDGLAIAYADFLRGEGRSAA
jgi:GDP-L-fucose synthase